MRLRLFPQPGYPFMLDLEIAYVLDEAGLRRAWRPRTSGKNPIRCRRPPLPDRGDRPIYGCSVRVPAAARLIADDRGIPTRRVFGGANALGLPEPLAIGDLQLDEQDQREPRTT